MLAIAWLVTVTLSSACILLDFDGYQVDRRGGAGGDLGTTSSTGGDGAMSVGGSGGTVLPNGVEEVARVDAALDHFALADDRVFYPEVATIMAAGLGMPATPHAEAMGDAPRIIAAPSNMLYWANRSTLEVWRADTGNAPPTAVGSFDACVLSSTPSAVAYTESAVWVATEDGCLTYLPHMDNLDSEPFAAIFAMAVFEGPQEYVYVMHATGVTEITSLTSTGNDIGGVNPAALLVDGASPNLYLADRMTRSVLEYDLPNPTFIGAIIDDVDAVAFALRSDILYTLAQDGSGLRILRTNLDTLHTDDILITAGFSDPKHIGVDATHLYFLARPSGETQPGIYAIAVR